MDRCISFVNALSKGKKNDYRTHNAFLNYANDYYDRIGLVNMNTIVRKMAHANNYGNKFKCRQKIEKMASYYSDCVAWVHTFSQKYVLKSPWDGSSKLVNNTMHVL